MGIAGALGLFASIVIHELSHSLVARRYGLMIKGITLFIFGGVAEMEEEPQSPKAEFTMALAGPASSLLIAAVFYGLALVSAQARWPISVTGVLRYLAFINILLMAFNLIPGFPLDGGRILRSILWNWKNNLRWATRIASQVGSAFGLFLIVMGVFYFLRGAFIGGLWWFLVGMFLRDAAEKSYQQLRVRQALEGEKVSDFMNPNPVTVSPSISVEQLVHDYIYRHHYKMFPVVEDGRILGCVTLEQVKHIPQEERAVRLVAQLATPCSEQNTVLPNDDAMKALAMMSRTGISRLMVVQDGQLVGILTLKDMLRFLSVKVQLEG